MDEQSLPGTQRLELPVSRTTLKVCGGVPMEISEKSVPAVSTHSQMWLGKKPSHQRSKEREQKHTLCVEEVVDEDVVPRLSFDGSLLLEHVLLMLFRADAHVLLAERLDLDINLGTFLQAVSVSTWTNKNTATSSSGRSGVSK